MDTTSQPGSQISHSSHAPSVPSPAKPSGNRPERGHRLREEPTVGPDVAFWALGLGRTTGYEALRSGAIPSIRLGRNFRIPTSWLREQLGIDDA